MFATPKYYLDQIREHFPDCLDGMNMLLAQYGDEYGEWPSWCLLPKNAWILIAEMKRAADEGPHYTELTDETLIQATMVASDLEAIATWSLTQGIYRFEPTVFEHLCQSPPSPKPSKRLLHRLPEHAVYIETAGLHNLGLAGFWAHMGYYQETDNACLNFLLNLDDGLVPLMVPLGDWPHSDALRYSMDIIEECGEGMTEDSVAREMELLPKCLALVTFLCEDKADIDDPNNHNDTPKRIALKPDYPGPQLYLAKRSRVWRVGHRTSKKWKKNPPPAPQQTPQPEQARLHLVPFSNMYPPLPEQYLTESSVLDPTLWKVINEVRSVDEDGEFGPWPTWSLMPVELWMAVASVVRAGDGPLGLTEDRFFLDCLEANEIEAIASWALSKGIYQFEPSVMEFLCNNEPSDFLSRMLLTELPEHGIFIYTPTWETEEGVAGFWANMRYEQEEDACSLHLLLAHNDGLMSWELPLGGWPLSEALDLATVEIKAFPDGVDDEFFGELLPIVKKCVSLVTFLCVQDHDIHDPKHPDKKPTRLPLPDPGEGELHPAPALTYWRVGYLTREQASRTVH
ncbi:MULTISPECIES: hypothetical protein [unclassified Aeromonas]|uniref:hypothetical protein n=1 Tax=unclassified Aeromonas TaxID=257493 RepID=UPI0022DF6653|nr:MULTISPECIES: hypothetical protein [unclassified Aeromonas]